MKVYGPYYNEKSHHNYVQVDFEDGKGRKTISIVHLIKIKRKNSVAEKILKILELKKGV